MNASIHQQGEYVIQFGSGTNFDAGRAQGRVEHVASSRAASFESFDELLSIMGRILDQSEAPQGAGRADPFVVRA